MCQPTNKSLHSMLAIKNHTTYANKGGKCLFALYKHNECFWKVYTHYPAVVVIRAQTTRFACFEWLLCITSSKAPIGLTAKCVMLPGTWLDCMLHNNQISCTWNFAVTYPDDIRMHSNAHNTSTWKARKLSILELLGYCPRNQIPIWLVSFIQALHCRLLWDLTFQTHLNHHNRYTDQNQFLHVGIMTAECLLSG